MAETFSEKVNKALRDVRGVTVGGHEPPENHQRINQWAREHAATGSFRRRAFSTPEDQQDEG